MRNRREILYICVLFILGLLSTSAFGQEGQFGNVHVNADGSTIFRFQDSTAKQVKIVCDCRLRRETPIIKGEHYHKALMYKDSTGIWTYITPPLASEVYTYRFEVNGKSVIDPDNPDSVRVRCDKLSTFIVSNTPQTQLYLRDSILGHVETLSFENPTGGKSRGLLVYFPPQYSENEQHYPVLYLLHGLNGNEYSWEERGRAVEILDNLIAQGRAKPMILVLPDANPEVLIARKQDVNLFKNILLYPTWNEMQFEKCYPALDSFLCSKYRFSRAPGDRAVAGLSAGAKQAANLANMYDSTFSSVGLFSPVVNRKQLPNSDFADIWIGGGQGDLFHYKINKFRRKTQRKHFTYTMYNSVGGHTWRNWRVYFTEYVQTLFR